MEHHVEVMKLLWGSFPEGEKPQWLPWDKILEYEERMVKDMQVDQECEGMARNNAKTSMTLNELGVGNALLIDDDALLENMNTIQRQNRLHLTTDVANRHLNLQLQSRLILDFTSANRYT